MSDRHEPRPEEHGGAPLLTRRQALQAGAAALGAAVLGRPGAAGAAGVNPAALTGTDPFVAAMHVHAVYSEGPGSWEQQYANAVAAGVDVLFQTDHDFRARAQNYMGRLSGTFTGSTTGSWSQHAATFSASGPIRVVVEAAGSTPATQTLAMADKPTAVNSFRTGIDGQTLTQVFGTSRLDTGARYEVVLTLSIHPAQGGRPRGQYSLRYRFQRGATPGRSTEGNGLVGVVLAPMPADGSTVTLNPQADIAAIWPTMLAIDHSSFLLAFVVTSPRSGVVADVQLQAVTVNRVRHDAAGVLAAQRAIQERYSAAYGVTGIVEEELSVGREPPEHFNPFGATPEFPLKTVTPTNWKPYYASYVDRMHAAGGVVSYNHPFGAGATPLLSAAQQTQTRRSVFTDLLADDLLGCDVLEVGYRIRGHMPFEQHLALWDTLSRHARFTTGNGASDDHSGTDWRRLSNGFLTGIWAVSSSGSDMASALRAGRAYAFHPGRAQGMQLDTLVDGAVPMGAAAVKVVGSRTIAIALAGLPSGCTLELVRGPVDLTGQDPGTSVVRTWSLAAGASTVSTAVDTSSSCFVRPQLRRNGALVATGNPTWLLRSAPPGGIPGPRAA
jgi:hypothetical protein